MSYPSGLGINEEYHADEMGEVKAAFKRGTFGPGMFGPYETIEDWIRGELIFVEDALRLVERLRKQQEGQAK